MKNKNSKYHPNVQTKIRSVIESHPDTLWQTLDQIIANTRLSVRNIYRVIRESDVFVITTNYNSEPVITTRQRYYKEQSFLKKVIGAFNNRIVY